MYQFKHAYQAGWIWGDVYESISRLAKLGYDGVEVAGCPEYFAAASKIKKACEDEGITASSICSMLADYDVAHPYKPMRQKGIDHAKRTVDFAAGLNCHTVILTPTQFGKYMPLAPIEEELKIGAESVTIVAEYAKTAGVNLCIEAWDRYDTYLITNLVGAKALAKKINMPNVGVMLDTFHMNIEEKDMAGAVYEAGDLLFHFHVGDSNRKAPGMGHIDFMPIFKALKDIQYRGYVTMELIPPAYNVDAYMTYADTSAYYLEYPAVSLNYLRDLEEKL